MKNKIQVGIDAGGTLIKIVYSRDEEGLTYAKFRSQEIKKAAKWILTHFTEADISITGGKSILLQKYLQRYVHHIVEFDATCRGVRYLLEKEEKKPESFVLTNAGTGTSIHLIQNENQHRIGGTGVGGGTIMGLSYLLTGINDYDQIVELATKGKRDRIDLKVSDIYEGAASPISGDLTASNFGKAMSHKDHPIPDILASIIGLVGETITTFSALAADQNGADHVVYIGSSFLNNEILKEVVGGYTKLRGSEPLFLKNGEYSGAIGALLSLQYILEI